MTAAPGESDLVLIEVQGRIFRKRLHVETTGHGTSPNPYPALPDRAEMAEEDGFHSEEDVAIESTPGGFSARLEVPPPLIGLLVGKVAYPLFTLCYFHSLD